VVRNIRLADDEEVFECKVEKLKGLALKTSFLKKAHLRQASVQF
jgi:protein PhnA